MAVYQRVADEIYSVLERIEQFPESGEVVSYHEMIRRTTVAKMNNVYWIVKPRAIVVLAITRPGQNFRPRRVS